MEILRKDTVSIQFGQIARNRTDNFHTKKLVENTVFYTAELERNVWQKNVTITANKGASYLILALTVTVIIKLNRNSFDKNLLIIVVKFSLFILSLKTSFYAPSIKKDFMVKRYLQSTKSKWCKYNLKIITITGKQNKWINKKTIKQTNKTQRQIISSRFNLKKLY